jgi:phospholipid/cholesterol/gamma-HCH transport system ATP-binding protein
MKAHSDSAISMEKVFKSFGDKHVLRGLNLEVKRGETFVILGPSGCGKSVTLKLITGLLKPDAGEIYINGLRTTRFKESDYSDLRQKFGFLFQNAALFDSMTVAENIAFGLRKQEKHSELEIQNLVEKNLRLVGLPGIQSKMPSELSGGMRKRVGLARAIAIEPEFMFYDEPTTGLDPIMSAEIDQLVLNLKDKLQTTSIVITHDLKSAFHIADRVALHYDGKLWETSTPEEFKQSVNPMVRQFIEGNHEGPIRT